MVIKLSMTLCRFCQCQEQNFFPLVIYSSTKRGQTTRFFEHTKIAQWQNWRISDTSASTYSL
jgi:hypothetical protein